MSDTASKIAALAGQPNLRGGVNGEEFWIGGGPGLGGLYPYATGELEEAPVGTRIRVFMGMTPVVYVVEMLVATLLGVWTAAAILAGLLHDAGILAVSVSWRPYAGLVLLVVILAAIIQGHRLGNRQRAGLLQRLREATGGEAIQS